MTLIPKAYLLRCFAGAVLMLMSTLSVAECVLKVGWEPWKPYSYLNDEGELTGLDVELVRAMASEAGCEVSFEQMPWARLLEGLRSGHGVQVVTGASRTTEREAYAWFSEPYRNETMQLFMPSEDFSKRRFDSFKDMTGSGFRLGITRNFFYGDDFVEAMENPEFGRLAEEVNTDLQNVLKLEAGRIDGFLADQFVAAQLIRENGRAGRVQAHPMVVNSGNIYLMFSKKSVPQEIVRKFDEALKRLKERGKHGEILSDYRNE